MGVFLHRDILPAKLLLLLLFCPRRTCFVLSFLYFQHRMNPQEPPHKPAAAAAAFLIKGQLCLVNKDPELNGRGCNKVSLGLQWPAVGLCFKHKDLLWAKLVPDKVALTH